VAATIEQFDAIEWPRAAAALVQCSVERIASLQGDCNVLLTGGRSAEKLYRAWSASPGFLGMTGVRFYFGDERCVPPDHQDSNFGLVMRTLFDRGIPAGASLHRMEAELFDHELAARRYEAVLPHRLDVMLLGVGEDGHIASLFPDSPHLRENVRRIVPVTAPKLPYERLTITPVVITGTRTIFVLAPGKAKAELLSSIIGEDGSVAATPARLAIDATWLLDTAL
jgi:6-phosphogluconolactonase